MASRRSRASRGHGSKIPTGTSSQSASRPDRPARIAVAVDQQLRALAVCRSLLWLLPSCWWWFPCLPPQRRLQFGKGRCVSLPDSPELMVVEHHVVPAPARGVDHERLYRAERKAAESGGRVPRLRGPDGRL